jgi:hypothetical protein
MLAPYFCVGGGVVTLQEILDAIAERYPHSLTNDNIIKKLNIAQQQLFRTIYKPITSTSYDIIADNPFYPIDYTPESLVDVVVNGEEYPFQNIEYDSNTEKFYYITDDNCMGLYPTPLEDAAGGLTVFHYKEPAELSESTLTTIPDFDKAWHMLLVYRVCNDIAQIALDGEMANMFATQYNGLEEEYKRSKRAKPHKTKDVYGVNWGAWV